MEDEVGTYKTGSSGYDDGHVFFLLLIITFPTGETI
jgi:hypothetical protein